MHLVDIEVALLIHDIEHFINTPDALPKQKLQPVLDHLREQYRYMMERAKPRPPAHMIALVLAAAKAIEREMDGQAIE